MAIAMLAVSTALGFVTFRQFENRRAGAAAGWAVGIAAMFLFQVMVDPMRDQLRRDECASYRGEEFAACMEGQPDPYDQREIGLF